MTRDILEQEKPSRFRIQELDDFQSIPVDSTPHNSFNMRSRFTVTTKDIHLNLNSKMLVFIKEQTKGEYVLFNNVSHSKFKIDKANYSNWSSWMNREDEEKGHNRNDSQSFNRQKTNDESESKGSYAHKNADCKKLSVLITQLKSNGFLLNPIEKIYRQDLLRSASIQSKGNYQITKDEQLNIQCNGSKKHYGNCDSNNQFNLEYCTPHSFSFLIQG